MSDRAEQLIPGLDRSAATHLAAVMVRSGLHDLQPWESPDHGHVDPLDDKGLQACIRQFLGGLYREAMDISHGI